MTYQEARAYIDNVGKSGIFLNLENMRELLQRLGNPQETLKYVHIAGTNGKGSTLAYVSTILRCAGYTVGRYSSPSVMEYREMIQVNEVHIEKKAYTKYIGRIKCVIEKMILEGKNQPTAFEIETAMAFLHFVEEGCDIVVLETGLGGALDATNIICKNICSVFTAISRDHMSFLGNTLEEITTAKAGIMKKGSPVICMEQDALVLSILKKTCEELEGRFHLSSRSDVFDVVYGFEEQFFSYQGKTTQYTAIKIKLAGVHQIDNATLALHVIESLQEAGFSISANAIYEGFSKTSWQGRFSVLQKDPLFIIDGAHNVGAAMCLKESIEMYFTNKDITFIMGVLADKEYEKIIAIVGPLAKRILTIEPSNKRALSSEVLAHSMQSILKSQQIEIINAKTIAHALELCKNTTKEDVIIAFGSLFFLSELTDAVKSQE